MSESAHLEPAQLRREYELGALVESAVAPDPVDQFARWFDEAVAANVAEPTAMTLATADARGTPSARIVLLKGFDRRGFTFFTNYNGRKGRDLAENPRAALMLFWQPLERQVRIEGTVEKVSREESEVYFHSRPRLSQISAALSNQSSVVASRQELERRQQELIDKIGEGQVPLPDFWGGYRVVPTAIEFWQGRRSRLHDRLLYTRNADGGWTVSRLEP